MSNIYNTNSHWERGYMKRKGLIYPEEYYHIFNRSNDREVIFHDTFDYARMLFLILHCQSEVTFMNLGRQTSYYVRHRMFNIQKNVYDDVITNRYIELVSFALMPNHFHLIVYEKEENGIARYLQRIQNAYTKYINAKYDKQGHLFQGPYKAVHVSSNAQLLHTSAYVHMNPIEILNVSTPICSFEWSSFQDYAFENRWNALLSNEVILKQFLSNHDYLEYVNQSGAKLI